MYSTDSIKPVNVTDPPETEAVATADPRGAPEAGSLPSPVTAYAETDVPLGKMSSLDTVMLATGISP